MPSKSILFEKPDGFVLVVTPAPKAMAKLKAQGKTEDEALAIVADITVAKAQSDAPIKTATKRETVLDSSIPSRRFRNSWRIVSGTVAVDMTEARKERMQEIRTERNQRLSETDKDMLRSTERGSADEPALKTMRQALRDLPSTVRPDVDAITDADSLAAYEPTWPEVV